MLVFNHDKTATPIELVSSKELKEWCQNQSEVTLAWAERSKFKAKANQWFTVPDNDRKPGWMVAGIGKTASLRSIGALPRSLPPRDYQLVPSNREGLEKIILGWGMGAYRYVEYRSQVKPSAKLYVDSSYSHVQAEVDAINLGRDLINRPAQDLLPHHLEAETRKVATEYGFEIQVTTGTELLNKGFNSIHAVGRASQSEPRLIDMRWGEKDAPKVTILGKGVCFDSGGLDLKTAAGMRSMKKDMGGAATALSLAKLIAARSLPVQLRVLIPTVENAVSGNAYRPGDVIRTYKGITVDVGNTDAEGRLILCDALALAAQDKPELMVDYATLTGAARIALGTELSAMFCNNDKLARGLEKAAEDAEDPIWRMPLFQDYRELLKSPIADLSNIGSRSEGGAITAALFLERFVDSVPWVHFDIMGSNIHNRPAHPCGGEVMAMRAVYHYLANRYK